MDAEAELFCRDCWNWPKANQDTTTIRMPLISELPFSFHQRLSASSCSSSLSYKGLYSVNGETGPANAAPGGRWPPSRLPLLRQARAAWLLLRHSRLPAQWHNWRRWRD